MSVPFTSRWMNFSVTPIPRPDKTDRSPEAPSFVSFVSPDATGEIKKFAGGVRRVSRALARVSMGRRVTGVRVPHRLGRRAVPEVRSVLDRALRARRGTVDPLSDRGEIARPIGALSKGPQTASSRARSTQNATLDPVKAPSKSQRQRSVTVYAGQLPRSGKLGGSTEDSFNWAIIREAAGGATIGMLGPEDENTLQKLVEVVSTALAAFKPQDEIEGMIAAQAVALHFGAMEALRRSMIADQPAEIAARLRRTARTLRVP